MFHANTLSWSYSKFRILRFISNYEKHCRLQFHSFLHQMEESLAILPKSTLMPMCSVSIDPLKRHFLFHLQGIIPLGECTIEAVRDNGQPYAFSVESSEITVSPYPTCTVIIDIYYLGKTLFCKVYQKLKDSQKWWSLCELSKSLIKDYYFVNSYLLQVAQMNTILHICLLCIMILPCRNINIYSKVQTSSKGLS